MSIGKNHPGYSYEHQRIIPATQPWGGIVIEYRSVKNTYFCSIKVDGKQIGLMTLPKDLWELRFNWFKTGVHWIEEK